MPEPLPLLIVGASVRAAAQSALRAGLVPWGADLFGDVDLPAHCRFQRVNDYPQGFLEVVDNGPPGPWLYTGGLENHPRLVEAIRQSRHLWGNRATTLYGARSPEYVSRLLHVAGLPCPALCEDDHDCAGGDWLLKPRAGCGGRGIIRCRNGEHFCTRTHFLQEFIQGESCAAMYVGDEGRAELIGTTRQLAGQDWLHARDFRYCGSIGPISLSADTVKTLKRIGDALAVGCRLRGLFGVDFILRNGVPFPVEVNPRYTASVEVLELGEGISALHMHRGVFAPLPQSGPVVPGKTRGFVGKAILFARESLCFPEEGPWQEGRAADLWAMPPFADIPHSGTVIPRGKPILTSFAGGESPAECESRLRQAARGLDRLLFGP